MSPLTSSRPGAFRAKADTPSGQAAFGLVDQAASSATNFGVVVLAATNLPRGEFGVFAAALLTYNVLVGAAQALIGQELIIATGDREERFQRVRHAAAFSLLMGTALGICVVLVGLLLPRDTGLALGVLGSLLPALFLQDTLRFGAGLIGRMELACLSDCSWLVVGVLLYLGASSQGVAESPAHFVALWGVAGAVSCFATLRLALPVHMNSAWRHYRRRSHRGYRFLLEFAMNRGTSQSLQLLLGAIVGAAATGAVRGGTAVFGPLGVVLQAIGGFGAPVLRRISPSRRDSVLTVLGVALLSLAAGFTATLLFLPDSVGQALLGDTWQSAHPLILPLGVQAGCLGISALVLNALRLVRPGSTLRLQVVNCAIVVPAFFGGLAVAGTTGAVWGLVAGSVAHAVVGVATYARLRRQGQGLAGLAAE